MKNLRHYRLIALDMDGTLLNARHETTAYTRSVIRQAAEMGYIVVLSTGRCLSELHRHLEVMSGISYIIGENGAWLWDVPREKTLYRLALSDEEVAFAFRCAADLDALPQVYVEGQSYTQCGEDREMIPYHVYDFAGEYHSGSRFIDDAEALCSENPGKVGKVNLYFSLRENRNCFIQRMRGRNVAIADSIAIGLEISPPDANKGRGLEALCEVLNISLASTIAVGDGGNDLDIIRKAGFSIAMGNASAEIKAIAHTLTDDCDHEGAAKAIERYLLGR